MKKNSARAGKAARIAVTVPLIAIIFAVSIFAAVLFRSFVTGRGSVSAGEMGDVSMTVTGLTSGQAISAGSSSFTLKKAGDRVTFSVSTENSSGQNLTHSASLALKSVAVGGKGLSSADGEYSAIKSCILVYIDGKFVDSLSHLTQAGAYDIFSDLPLPDGMKDVREVTFELHSAATQYKNVRFELSFVDYAKSADARKYIFVGDEDEFSKAIDDINSGLITDYDGNPTVPTVVLSENIVLTGKYTATSLLRLDLCGKNISGGTLELCADAEVFSSSRHSAAPSSPVKMILNSSSSVLDIRDFYSSDGENVAMAYANAASVTDFSRERALALVAERAKEKLSGGITSGGSADALTSLSFYLSGNGISAALSGDGNSISGSVISCGTRSATDVGELTLSVDGESETISFRQFGSDGESVLDEIKSGALAHIEAITGSAEPVMDDIYLPSEIKKYGASIEWVSTRPDIIASDGRIIDDSADRETVTLYANVRINEKVYQLEYSFVVSGINNDVRFSNFIAQLSPLQLKEVWRGNTNTSSEDFKKSHQFLPIVNTGSDYHYIKSFTSPEGELTTAKLVWEGYEDVGLEYLVYSQDATYNYVSVYTNSDGEQAVYLNTPVFSTFAQINLTAKFVGDDKIYTGTVNVIIETGNYEELLDEVFFFVQEQLDSTDIYKNIIKTRMANGMKEEKGDFFVDAKYVISSASQSDKYSITLDTGSSGGVLSATENAEKNGYDISVDMTKATQVESRVPISVTVSYTYEPKVTSTRTLYVTVPAVILPDENGFANYSVFSSVKYQLFGFLPSEERTKSDEAFTVSGTKVINNTKPYILIKDIDRCSGSDGNFFEGIYAGESLTIGYGSKLDSLYLPVGTANAENPVEEKVYGLLALIRYATGNEKGTKTVTSGGKTYSISADGKQYLTPDEISALKSYYEDVTGGAVDFDTLFASVSYYPEANGARSRVITDSVALGNAIKSLTSDTTTYFKYTELMRWALNEQNFPKSAFFDNSYPIGNPPNGGSLRFNATYTVTGGTSYTFYQSGGTMSLKNGDFNEDDTEYISEREEVVLQAFWNNAGSLSAFKNAFAAYTVTPTYLESGAVSALVGAMYNALGCDGFSEELVLCEGKTVPAITSADGALEALPYFAGLRTLVIKGAYTESGSTVTAELPAFLHTDSLATFYGRLTSSGIASALQKLVLYNCAQDYVTFELDGISAFESIEYLDLGMNYGIKALGAALDLPLDNVKYIDLSGADSADKYSSYPLSVLAGKVNRVYYSPDTGRDGKTASKVMFDGRTNDLLSYLRELETVDSGYVQLQQRINLGAASSNKTHIYWQLDSGNPIYQSPVSKAGVFTSGTYGEYDAPAGMNGELTNWFYYDGRLYSVKRGTDGIYLYDEGALALSDSAPGLTDEDKAELEKLLTGNVTYGLTFEKVSETAWQTGAATDIVAYSRNSRYYIIYIDNGTRKVSSSRYRHIYKIPSVKTVTYSFTYRGSDSAQKAITAYLSSLEAVVEYTYSYGRNGEVSGTVTVEVTKNAYYANNSSGTAMTDTAISIGSAEKVYWSTSSNSYTETNSSVVNYFKATYEYGGNSFDYSSSGTFTDDSLAGGFPSELKALCENGINLTGATNTETLESTKTVTTSVPYLADETEREAALARLESIAGGEQSFEGGYSVFLYSGTSGDGSYFSDGTETVYSFVKNRFYRLVMSGDTLTWQDTGIDNPSATDTTVTMESILAQANTYAQTVMRGNWLGLYVWYEGSGDTSDGMTVNGRTYKKGCVYRIVWKDEGHTEFTYDDAEGGYRLCEAVTASEFASKPLSAVEGSMYYLKNATNFYAADKFYIMTYDDVGGFYYLNRFGDAAMLLKTDEDGTSHSYLRMKNSKLYITTSEDYSGTGGTEYIDVTAVVKVGDEEYTRTFRVAVIG